MVQELPWRRRVQGSIFLIGGLGFMFDVWDATRNGFLMAVGAFVWGSLADVIGRKTAFTLTLLIFSVFTVLGAVSHDIVPFCVFRFVAGFGLGGCIPVDYALVGEFTPRKHRGRVLTAMDAWWPVGASLFGVVSAVLMASFGNCRLLMLVLVLPALLGALTWKPSILVATGYAQNKAFMATASMTAIGFLVQVAIPVLYTYVSELYPTHLRATGFGGPSTISRVGAGLVPLICGSLLWPVLACR